MACDIWLRRDYLLRHGLEPDEPPCDHPDDICPPSDRTACNPIPSSFHHLHGGQT